MFRKLGQALWRRQQKSRLKKYITQGLLPSLQPDRLKAFLMINETFNETELLMNWFEAFQLHSLVKSIAKIPGDIAEVGVYKGGSAKIIAEAKSQKELFLFDTFEGIPHTGPHDQPGTYTGQHAADIKDVEILLQNYSGIHIHKGSFPFPCSDIAKRMLSFVHLDVNTYESTYKCLNFFYPKVTSGGVIISHNYLNNRGVFKAINDFFQVKPEIVIELVGSFGMIIKA
jgi:O-methyltransferase